MSLVVFGCCKNSHWKSIKYNDILRCFSWGFRLDICSPFSYELCIYSKTSLTLGPLFEQTPSTSLPHLFYHIAINWCSPLQISHIVSGLHQQLKLLPLYISLIIHIDSFNIVNNSSKLAGWTVPNFLNLSPTLTSVPQFHIKLSDLSHGQGAHLFYFK